MTTKRGKDDGVGGDMIVWDWVRPRACASLRAWAIDRWLTHTPNPNRSIALHGYERGTRLLGLEVVSMGVSQGYLP